jgi:hypothetical protein
MGTIAATGRYPGFAGLMAAFAGTGYDLNLDAIFELGLRTMLDGLAVLLNVARPRPESTADLTAS